jgi:hypothetical protein
MCRMPDGTVQVIPAWMLDPSECARMELGGPRVSAQALEDVRAILRELGFDRLGAADPEQPQKKAFDEAETVSAQAPDDTAVAPAPGCPRHALDAHERAGLIAVLARLLLEAVPPGRESEGTDDTD